MFVVVSEYSLKVSALGENAFSSSFSIVLVVATLINLNAASSVILASLPMMTEDMVRDIMTFREEKDFTSLGQLASIVGPSAFQAAVRYLTLQLGPYYTIISTGLARDHSTISTISAVMKIDNRLPEHYQILMWNDSSEPLKLETKSFQP